MGYNPRKADEEARMREYYAYLMEHDPAAYRRALEKSRGYESLRIEPKGILALLSLVLLATGVIAAVWGYSLNPAVQLEKDFYPVRGRAAMDLQSLLYLIAFFSFMIGTPMLIASKS